MYRNSLTSVQALVKYFPFLTYSIETLGGFVPKWVPMKLQFRTLRKFAMTAILMSGRNHRAGGHARKVQPGAVGLRGVDDERLQARRGPWAFLPGGPPGRGPDSCNRRDRRSSASPATPP